MYRTKLYLMMLAQLLFNIVFKVVPNVTIAFFWFGFRELRRGGVTAWLRFVRVFPSLTVAVYRANYERVCREHEQHCRNKD